MRTPCLHLSPVTTLLSLRSIDLILQQSLPCLKINPPFTFSYLSILTWSPSPPSQFPHMTPRLTSHVRSGEVKGCVLGLHRRVSEVSWWNVKGQRYDCLTCLADVMFLRWNGRR